MSLVYVFPGQGSQYRGMGEGLFDKFADLTAQADEQLGYSLQELCLRNPGGLLNKTQYTQPALYSVNVFTYLDALQNGHIDPDAFFAGHSLGEFSALFAAGAYSYLDGLKIVQERGRLMAQAPSGAMAAVLGLDYADTRALLTENGFSGVDIANYNSRQQIILSGLHDDIDACERAFDAAGARFIPLNVSAAFHSRYMQPVQAAFARFLEGCEMRPLERQIVANVSARPYPRHGYQDHIVRQLTHPVLWYESVSWMLEHGMQELVELGPGKVLTDMYVHIRNAPLVNSDRQERDTVASGSVPQDAPARVDGTGKNKVVFMYGGQGSQYYSMGKELYANNPVFKESMDACDALLEPMLDVSIADLLYRQGSPLDEFSDVRYTHPALYCFGYSLTRVLQTAGIVPDAVLGYSLGEYVAATVAGVISLEDGLRMVVEQSRQLSDKAAGGGMLTILNDVKHWDQNPALYTEVSVASVNYHGNFVVSGTLDALETLKRALDEQSIASLLLPVEHAFHSRDIDSIEADFKSCIESLRTRQAEIPFYSCANGGRLENVDQQYWWDVIRRPVRFSEVVGDIAARSRATFVDLSPTGILSGFIKRGFDAPVEHHFAINQFGRNLQTVGSLIAALG